MSLPSFPRADALLAGVRRYLALRAVTAFALWIASGIALLLLAGWLLAGPEGWRQGTPGPLILDLAAMLCGGAGIVAVWRGWVARLTDRQVTSAVERSAGLAEGAFLGAVELARATPQGTSAALASLAEAGVSARVRARSTGVLAGALGDRVLYWRRIGVVAFTSLGLAAAVGAWSAPERAKSAWTGLLYPLRALAAPIYAALEVEPGDVDVARGASVEVGVRAPGRERVTLRWQAEGDVARIETLSVVNGATSFTFDSVTAAVQYSVSAPDGARTDTYRIRPVDPLFLSRLDVGVFYPEYTGRPAEEFSDVIPALEIPAGTRLRIAGRTSRELGSAALAGPSGDAGIAFRVTGAAFQGEWRPRQSGSYAWQLVDAAGAAAPAAHPPLEIRITTDASPEVLLVFPGKDTLISVTLRQPLVIQASDDYGLEQLELISYRVSSFGERGEPVTTRFESEGAAALELRPVLDVSEWGLLPGDTVRYFARVLETGPEGKTAQTREFALRLPSISELRWDAQRDVEQLGATLQDLAARMEAAQREASVQARRAATSANQASRADARSSGSTGEEGRAGLDYSQTEDARRAVEEQEQILAQLDSMRVAASQLLEALQQAGLSDTELRRRLAELQELLSEVAEGELQANLERAADALQSLDPEELRRALDALAQ
ncbi:MAG: hypothetical protein HY701_13705, partial [Gemmatimonadetes bacterium]|nr:hypothetical protein [Gemmatimonadota bacterium]